MLLLVPSPVSIAKIPYWHRLQSNIIHPDIQLFVSASDAQAASATAMYDQETTGSDRSGSVTPIIDQEARFVVLLEWFYIILISESLKLILPIFTNTLLTRAVF